MGASPVVLFLAFSCAGTGSGPTGDSSQSPTDAAARVTADRIREHVGFLASDALAGRDTPGRGLESAAAYVAAEFGRMGLETGGEDGAFVRRWPYIRVTVRPDSGEVILRRAGVRVHLRSGVDYWPLPSETQRWAGHTVSFSSFTALDTPIPPALDGRMALVPLPADERLDEAIILAIAAGTRSGAGALAMVLPPGVERRDAADVTRQLADVGLVRLVPTVLIHPDALRNVAQEEGVDEFTGTVHTPTVVERFNPPNVVGVLPGRDSVLARSYVVLSAHLDHVGVGTPDESGDSIYNGADDNASGVAVLLEVADALSRLHERPRRSVIFLAASGEERGLLGSRDFTDDPSGRIDRVVANVNLDMLGRNDPGVLFQLGGELSSLGPLAEDLARRPGLGLALIPDPDSETDASWLRGDHVSFLRYDVPSLFLTSGLHPDYHRPSDEVGRLDTDKAARTGQLVFWLVRAVADDAERPAWTPQGLGVVRAMIRGM